MEGAREKVTCRGPAPAHGPGKAALTEEKAWRSNQVEYGVVIDDALSDPKTKLSKLEALQKSGQKTLARWAT